MTIAKSITAALAQKLVTEQFPQYAQLAVHEVELQGHDNRTFRLGDDLLMRLPSSEIYAAKVAIEQKWLPFLAQNLSLQIPRPIALGKACEIFPMPWSIYSWIDGASANAVLLDDEDLKIIAKQLAEFLNELHQINTKNTPQAGVHNFFRGQHPKVYEAEAKSAFKKLENLIDEKRALALWNKALESRWNKNSVWIHGDLAAGNILLKNNQLIGVIDWGGMAVGDPACDLTIAWTFFRNESREIFQNNLNFDEATWIRARAWGLWKAAIELVKISDKNSNSAKEQQRTIAEIL